MRAIWAGRSRVNDAFWRLYFVICDDGEPLGMHDLIATDFATLGTVESFSWLAPAARGRGLGKKSRAAILHLAFEGFDARQAASEAFIDNHASNRVSEALGYTRNVTSWCTRREGRRVATLETDPGRVGTRRRTDIELSGVEACKPGLSL